MSEPREDDQEMSEVLKRMHSEFGPRRPSEEPPSGDPRLLPPPESRPEPRAAVQVTPLPPDNSGPMRRPLVRSASDRRRIAGASVTWTLIGLNVAYYLVSVVLSGFDIASPAGTALRSLGWKENLRIANGEYWRLISAMFLHGNLVHIFFNSYSIYVLGPEAERIYGHLRYFALYMIAGLAGSIASYALNPYPAVGASGAVFGLVGGLGIFYYMNRRVLGQFGQQQFQTMLAVLFINLLIGFGSGGSIDNFAHIGGLLGGVVCGFFLAPRFSLDTRLEPPTLVRRAVSGGWGLTLGFLLLLCVATLLIQPPL